MKLFKFWKLYTSLHQPQYVVFLTIQKRRLPFGNRLLFITSKIRT